MRMEKFKYNVQTWQKSKFFKKKVKIMFMSSPQKL